MFFPYLGLWLCSSTSFKVDFSECRRIFFATVNAVLSKCKFASELCKLKLVETSCLPIIMYAIESLNLKPLEMKEINSWWNAVYRKNFNFQKWESVKLLICLCERLDFIHLENLKRINFIKSMSISATHNDVIKHFLNCYIRECEFTSVLAVYKSELNLPKFQIKSHVYSAFKQQVSFM